MNDLLEENDYYTRRLDVQKSCIYLTNFFKNVEVKIVDNILYILV